MLFLHFFYINLLKKSTVYFTILVNIQIVPRSNLTDIFSNSCFPFSSNTEAFALGHFTGY